MSSGEFDHEGWIADLANALRGLNSAQKPYSSYINQQWELLNLTFGFRNHLKKSEHLAQVLCSLYGQPAGNEPPLKDALYAACKLLASYPPLVDVLDSLPEHAEQWMQDIRTTRTGLLSVIISGLMARAEELTPDGFAKAVNELCMLLEPEDKRHSSGGNNPSVGYHVALFRGLLLDQDVIIENDIKIVPFNTIKEFVDLQFLDDLSHNGLRGHGQDLAAIIKPFRRRPQLPISREDSDLQFDAHDFLEDAEGLVELLAVLHESPVVCLAKIAVCKHRIASLFLGVTHSHSGITYGRSGQSFHWREAPITVKPELIKRACTAFQNRKSNQYKVCAPIIGRLSEALSRGGRFGNIDKILDVAIALESMYQLDHGEISYKLRTRAAFFLADEPNERQEIFQKLKEFYEVRSSIIHGRTNYNGVQDVFNRSFHIARRTVDKLLVCGLPDNWNDVILTGTNSSCAGGSSG